MALRRRTTVELPVLSPFALGGPPPERWTAPERSLLETPPQQRTPLQWAEGMELALSALSLSTQRGDEARIFLRQALLAEFEELGVGILPKRLTQPHQLADLAVVQLAGHGEINLKNLNTALGAEVVDKDVLPAFRQIVAEVFVNRGSPRGEECASSFKSVTLAYFREDQAPNLDSQLQQGLDEANLRFSAHLTELLEEKLRGDNTDGEADLLQRMLRELGEKHPAIGMGISTFVGGEPVKAALQARFEAQAMANRARSEKSSRLYRFEVPQMKEVLKDISAAVAFLHDRTFEMDGIRMPVLERESRLNLRLLELHRKDPRKLPEDIREKVKVLISRANVMDFIFYGTNKDLRERLPERIEEGHALLEQLESDRPLGADFQERFERLLRTNCAGEPIAQNMAPSHGQMMLEVAGKCPEGVGALLIDMLRLGLYARQELIQRACDLAKLESWTPADLFKAARKVNNEINTRKNRVTRILADAFLEVAAEKGIPNPVLGVKAGGDERLVLFDAALLPLVGEVLKRAMATKPPAFRASAVPLRNPAKLFSKLDSAADRATYWEQSLGEADRLVDLLKRYEVAFRSLLLYAKDRRDPSLIDNIQTSMLGRLYLKVDSRARPPFILKDWKTGKKCTEDMLAEEIERLRGDLGMAAERPTL